MSNDLTMTIAILVSLKLITKKEGVALFDELKYKNLSTSFDDCLNMIKEAFKVSNIGTNKVLSEIEVNGKKITISK